MSDEVMVYVRRSDRWLVLRRSPRQGGYWHLVAGGVEPDEDDAAAAARELREETGLEAEPVPLGCSFEYAPEAWEPRSRLGTGPFSVACFVADAPPAWEPELDWEHDEARWCTREEALELLFWPEPRRLLEELA